MFFIVCVYKIFKYTARQKKIARRNNLFCTHPNNTERKLHALIAEKLHTLGVKKFTPPNITSKKDQNIRVISDFLPLLSTTAPKKAGVI